MIPHFRYRNSRWVAVCTGITIGIIVLLVVIDHRGLETTLSNGVIVQVTPASTFASLCSKASCKILCHTSSGKFGTIILLQNSDSCLAMVMPGTDGQHLLFLYDADVHYRLMRIDLNNQSVRFPSGSYLSYIVLSSSWNVEEGTSNDWNEAYSYLKTVSQSDFDQQAVTKCNFGVVRFHYQRRELLSEVEREIYNSQHGLVY